MTAPRTILHVDMDAFFVSVELLDRPELSGRPVVVGGSGRRGVVAAASYEARRYGVFSAMSSVVARRRCPDAVFVAGRHRRYAEVSEQVFEVFARYTPLVEPLSLDEAFLDVGGAQRLFGTGSEIGHRIRRDIHEVLGLRCSVGVAANKFIAKLASVEAKPVADRSGVRPGRGVFEVPAGREVAFLRPLPVERLWGVGPKTLDKLQRLGIVTVGDVASLDRRALVAALGESSAQHLIDLAAGRDDRPVQPDRAAKSISHEETYPSNKHTIDELDRELVRQADAVAQRLRQAGVGARTLTIKVRFDAGFRTMTRSTTTSDPVDHAPAIIAALRPLLVSIDPTPGVRLFGVAASNLGPMRQQLSFDDLDTSSADWSAATEALDRVRAKFGADSIGPASSIERGRLRPIERGAQQWGPDDGDAAPTDRGRR